MDVNPMRCNLSTNVSLDSFVVFVTNRTQISSNDRSLRMNTHYIRRGALCQANSHRWFWSEKCKNLLIQCLDSIRSGIIIDVNGSAQIDENYFNRRRFIHAWANIIGYCGVMVMCLTERCPQSYCMHALTILTHSLYGYGLLLSIRLCGRPNDRHACQR